MTKEEIPLTGSQEERLFQLEQRVGWLSPELREMVLSGKVELKEALIYERDPEPKTVPTEEEEEDPPPWD